MKKILLTLLCLVSFVTINAETASITFSEQGYTNAQEVKSVAINDEITLVFDKGSNSNTCKYYNTGTAMRVYGGGTMTVQAASGTTINSVTMITGSGDYVVNSASTVSAGTLAINGTTATISGVNGNEVVFTQGGSKGHVRIQSVTVDYTGGTVASVATPTFSAEGGIFTEPFDLTLSAEEGNSIYYTLDGTKPTTDSNLYQGEAIKISEYTVVKAIAVDGQGASSSVATATYAFQNTESTAMTVAEALAWIEDGKDATTEQYVVGYITEITEVSTNYGNATYNIADAIGSTDVLVVFRGKYLNGEKFTAEDQIEVGDKVLIYGKLKDYNGTPEVDTNNYIVSIIEDISVGIEEIATENAPVEYYNLQGVKVANPENGLFIKKQGGKATKVVL